jgi:hypothetical protein
LVTLEITLELHDGRELTYDGITKVTDSSNSVVIVRDGEVLAAIDKADIRQLIILDE